MVASTGAECTTQFYMYSIETADPLLYIVGDGYLGLGLDDGHEDEAGTSYSTLWQLKKHGIIDKLQFGIFAKMGETELVS